MPPRESKYLYCSAWILGAIISFGIAGHPFPFSLLLWSTSQWIPLWGEHLSYLKRSFQNTAWHIWEDQHDPLDVVLAVPVLDVSLPYSLKEVSRIFGNDWRTRPLYLKNLWNASTLADSSRKLSVQGLLKEEMMVPYFTDATITALRPDAEAPLCDVMKNITLGFPHKVGTQFLLQGYPELVREVAPARILKELFGDYFEPQHLKASGPYNLFPALTTVPLFVSGLRPLERNNGGERDSSSSSCSQDRTEPLGKTRQPRTDLHCEPIGNIAVQLESSKRWTLVSPEHTFRLLPGISPDGRAFFASYSQALSHVPRYYVETRAGDALWIPTWTWHRVDYDSATAKEGESLTVSVGASLFHFRSWDFIRNNPLFAVLVIPSLVKEVLGMNAQ